MGKHVLATVNNMQAREDNDQSHPSQAIFFLHLLRNASQSGDTTQAFDQERPL